MTRIRAAAIMWLVCLIAAGIPTAATQEGAGTAEISGTVVTTTVPPTPLARVLVTVTSPSMKPGRTLITDEQGRFAFRNLPPGGFTIVAARPPYVKTAFGAKRPGRPGTPINLTAGQRVTGITIPVARGAAITGVIRHTTGETAPGIKVEATPLIVDPSASVASAAVVSDDRGVYRIFGLPPGRYVVTATFTDLTSTVLTQYSDLEMDQMLARLQRRSAGLPAVAGPIPTPGAPATSPARPGSSRRSATYGYAPMYFPGTPDFDQATTLVLAEGEEHAGVDIALELVPTSAVEGRVSVAGGALPSGTQITLTRQGLPERRRALDTLSQVTAQQPDSAGAFHFTGVFPGKYRVMARATTMTPVAAAASSQPAGVRITGVFWALADVTVGDDDVSGLALMLQPGLRVSGRIAFDGHTRTPPRDLTTVHLRLADVDGASNFIPVGSGRADGTFEIGSLVPGTYTITSALSDAAWSLRSVMVDGRDVLDFPLELGAGDVSGLVATFTDQHTELSGSLQSAANVPAPDYFVVVFSSDRSFWRPGSRRVQSTRPGTDGHFTLRDLPGGDYLMAALTDIEPSDLADVSFIEHLIPAALPVHLNDGQKTIQDLKLAR